jgi:tetraacyldisaccharide 4'-kinase
VKAPDFWARPGFLGDVLSPLGWVTEVITARRLVASGFNPGIPVICVGNAGVGGAGKTPVVLDLLGRLPGRPFALTRGYRGRLRGPVLVDLSLHGPGDVGDEALLLAAHAPTVVARDRAAGARLALAEGATVIVMDDGLQNPGLAKTMSLLVVDGGYGFGNARLLPAGPLREPVAAAASRCRAAVMIGPDATNAASLLGGLPVLQARLVAECATPFAGRPMLAFAGIGRPEKFFESVTALGGNVVARRSFPDHHRYRERDAESLLEEAGRYAADLVTTAKDYVKLSRDLQKRTLVVRVRLAWENENLLRDMLR